MKDAFIISSPPSLLCLFHFLLLSSYPARTRSGDLIDKICRATPFYDLCESSLRPKSRPSADAKALAMAMTNIVLGNMSQTLEYIESQLRQTRDPQVERHLANCAELYRPVVKYNIPQAIDAMSKGEFGFASYVLTDAEKQADSCAKGFSDQSPMADRSKRLKNLCEVALSIIKMVTKS